MNELAVNVMEIEERAGKEMLPLITRARAFMVVSMQTYDDADVIATEIKEKVKDREIELLPPKEAVTKAWKAMCALVKKYIDDPKEIVTILDRKRYAWKKEEDRKRVAEADRLRREEEQKQADALLVLAERLESNGMAEQADEVLSAPREAVVTPEIIPVAKPAGQVNVENWQATLVNADLVPREWCMPDMVRIGKYGKMMKAEAKIEGVAFEDVGSVRRPK